MRQEIVPLDAHKGRGRETPQANKSFNKKVDPRKSITGRNHKVGRQNPGRGVKFTCYLRLFIEMRPSPPHDRVKPLLVFAVMPPGFTTIYRPEEKSGGEDCAAGNAPEQPLGPRWERKVPSDHVDTAVDVSQGKENDCGSAVELGYAAITESVERAASWSSPQAEAGHHINRP